MPKRRINIEEERDAAKARVWCWYCDRNFDDNLVLTGHQQTRHFKCKHCGKTLKTAQGLCIHVSNVHKKTVELIENTLPGRESTKLEIYGQVGVPEGYIQQKHDEIDAEYEELARKKRAETGNPLKGSLEAKIMAEKAKIPKNEETKEELKARRDKFIAENRAKKAAAKKAQAEGSSSANGGGDAMEIDSNPAPGMPGYPQAPASTSPGPFTQGPYGAPATIPTEQFGHGLPTANNYTSTFASPQAGFMPPQTGFPPTSMTSFAPYPATYPTAPASTTSFAPHHSMYPTASASPTPMPFGYPLATGMPAQVSSPFTHGPSPYAPPAGPASTMPPMQSPYAAAAPGSSQGNGPARPRQPGSASQSPHAGLNGPSPPQAKSRVSRYVYSSNTVGTGNNSVPNAHGLPQRPNVDVPNATQEEFTSYHRGGRGEYSTIPGYTIGQYTSQLSNKPTLPFKVSNEPATGNGMSYPDFVAATLPPLDKISGPQDETDARIANILWNAANVDNPEGGPGPPLVDIYNHAETMLDAGPPVYTRPSHDAVLGTKRVVDLNESTETNDNAAASAQRMQQTTISRPNTNNSKKILRMYTDNAKSPEEKRFVARPPPQPKKRASGPGTLKTV